MSVFPKELRNEFNHTVFIPKANCSDITTKMVPTYMRVSKHMWPGILATYSNLRNSEESSCSATGSWVSGNIASTAKDIAKFFYYYLGTEKIISSDMRSKLLNIDKGDEPGFYFNYGVGLLIKWYFSEKGAHGRDAYKNYFVGHPGMDDGSFSDSSGYNMAYNFSFSLASNTYPSLNCNLEGNEFWNNDQF